MEFPIDGNACSLVVKGAEGPQMEMVTVPDSRTTGRLRAVRWFVSLSVVLSCVLGAGAQKAYQFAGPVGVGSAAGGSITVPVRSDGTIGTALVLTGGIPALDFSSVSGGTCAPGNHYTAGQSCTMTVNFQPTAPGERRGAVVLLDTTGAVMSSLPLYGISTGPLSVFLPATINTVAGNGQWLYKAGDDGIPATTSPLFLPGGVAVDPAGNVFIADSSNNRIRRVDAVSGLITSVAGDGIPGYANDGKAAATAEVSNPGNVVLDGAGNLYIADSGNHAVRKLVLATGNLTTIAGQLGVQGSTGDGGVATAALLNSPEGLALDAAGDLYISDTGNNVVRKVDAATQIITTYAGTIGGGGFGGDGGVASAALLDSPWGLATDPAGDVYIADLGNSRVREVTTAGMISTVAGTSSTSTSSAGLPATATNLKNAAAVAVDVAGNLYVADSGHDLVLKISASTGLVSFPAGNGGQTFGGDLGPATKAGLYGPYALVLDSTGNLYIADIFHNRIREVLNAQATLSYSSVHVGSASAPQNQVLENDGNAALQWLSFTPDTNSLVDTTDSTCGVGTPLSVNATCLLAAEFNPQVIGNPVKAVIQIGSTAVDTPGVLTLSGQSNALTTTSTVVVSSMNPSPLSGTVTFTATVTGSRPTGSVQFFDGSTSLGSVSVSATGVASVSVSTLALGSHVITATYGGDPANTTSTSSSLTQVVMESAAVTLASSVNPTNVGASTTFTANVSAGGAPASGSVVFSDGSTVLGTVSLNASGIATLPVSSLSTGTHTIVAAFGGNASVSAANSAPLAQTVSEWPTTTTVGSSITPSLLGQNVTFTITVTSGSTVTPAGTVTILDGSTPLATLTLNASATATYSSTTLTVGTHTLTAKFAGDATNAASTSRSFSQTVNKIGTTTTLNSSLNPSHAGGAIQLAATVTSATTNGVAGPLAGTVTFTEGANTLGTATLSAAGTATASISSLAVGPHTIVANYLGNNGYASSTSSVLTQVVQLAVTTVAVTSSSSPSTVGNNVFFTAVVTGNGGIPTGTVTFLDGSTVLGHGTINSAGQATFSTSTLIVGTHPITASYSGDAADAPSVSGAMSQVVQQTKTAITLVSSSNPGIAGTPITFAATISSNGGIPTGPLQLMEGSNVLATATISGTGGVQFTLSSLSAGPHSLVASFGGDANDGPATSAVLVEVVQLGDTKLALTSNANPSTTGSPVVFTAKVTGTGNQPTGMVSFFDGATNIGTASLSAGAASVSVSTLALGTHSITAIYGGDSTHNPSPVATLTQLVQQTTTTALTSTANPSIVGTSITLNATITGASGTPTGAVSFYDGSTLLGSVNLAGGVASFSTSSLAAGPHLLLARYSGDTNSLPSESASLTQVVNAAGTTVSLGSSANPSTAGNAVTFTATVTSTGQQPTGAVTFMDGSTVLGTSPVSNGIATLTVSTLSAGQHAIVARYAGDAVTQGSTSGVLVQVVQQHTATTLVASANPILTAQSLTLTATVTGASASGTVTFSDGTTVLGQAVVSAGTATLVLPSLASGTHSITASYSGDNFNFASTSSSLSEIVNLRPSSTSVTSSSATYLAGEQVTLVAVVQTNGPVAATGTVTFSAGGVTLGTVSVGSAGAATLTFAPTSASYSVTASYSGDSVYLPSAAAAYTIHEGASSTFGLVATPSTVSMASGDHMTLNVTLSSTAQFADTLSLACLDLPTDATCTFSANQVKLSAGGTITTQLVLDTGLPLGAGPRASTAAPHSKIFSAALALPAALLMFFFPALKRRRRLAPLLALALLLTGFGLTGCGSSLNVSSTPTGSYQIRLLATGNTTGLTQTTNVTLTVK